MRYEESAVLELKEQVNADFKKEIIAFANTDGGEIFVGVARDGSITGVENAEAEMERIGNMIRDGIKELIVQPTHIINGIENDLMKEDVLAYADHFDSIRFGTPLLTSTKDIEEAIRAFMEDWKDLPEKEALVLMGHGTTHYANTAYAALDYTFKDLGYSNVLIGTVEAYPSIPSILRGLKELQPEKIHLTPFMIVAGDHATNDMAGEEEDSWKNQFEAAGYTVECHLKGLGEYEGIRKIFLKHIEESK